MDKKQETNTGFRSANMTQVKLALKRTAHLHTHVNPVGVAGSSGKISFRISPPSTEDSSLTAAVSSTCCWKEENSTITAAQQMRPCTINQGLMGLYCDAKCIVSVLVQSLL